MKLKKRKGYNNSIRKVCDDSSHTIGFVGTVKDLLLEDVLEYCDYDLDGWVFLDTDGRRALFGKTREDVLRGVGI